MMAKILVVDDEVEIGDLLSIYLIDNKHEVEVFRSPKKILEQQNLDYDLAILDIMMPVMNGFELCQEIRDRGYNFPIIMLTAKDEDQDKIKGLMLGADDYIVKPFNPLEVVARINAQLRRSKLLVQKEEEMYEYNGLQLFPSQHKCLLLGKELIFTSTEFAILYELFKNQGKVISSEEIFESVWKEKFLDSNNTVIVHVQSIRKKMGDINKKKKFIQTVWGVGYKIEKIS